MRERHPRRKAGPDRIGITPAYAGKTRHEPELHIYMRITPAYAGKTSTTSRSRPSRKDHPRVCGKDIGRVFFDANLGGSPPRMRERRFPLSWYKYSMRITPAYAGKTRILPSTAIPRQDHPRVCGKDTRLRSVSFGQRGSPPRMRERLLKFLALDFVLRITPAYAGKTWAMRYINCKCQDHPRVCGKDMSGQLRRPRYAGSPPRMRERLFANVNIFAHWRITPAYAGKTHPGLCGGTDGQDHPRVCGKDKILSQFFHCALGSPPRMRERLNQPIPTQTLGGITPAYAGKTFRWACRYF